MPNLVASTTWSRLPARTRPTSCLVVAGAVHVGGVEEGDAEFDRAFERRSDSASSRRAIEVRHAHAAEADSGDFQAAVSDKLLFHDAFSSIRSGFAFPLAVQVEFGLKYAQAFVHLDDGGANLTLMGFQHGAALGQRGVTLADQPGVAVHLAQRHPV